MKIKKIAISGFSVITLLGLMTIGLFLPLFYFCCPTKFYWLNFVNNPPLTIGYSLGLILLVIMFMLFNAYLIQKKNFFNDIIVIMVGYMLIMFSIVSGYALLYTYFLPDIGSGGWETYIYESAKTFATLGVPSFERSGTIFMKLSAVDNHQSITFMNENNFVVLFTAIAEALLAHVVTVFYLSIVLYRYSTVKTNGEQ
ncbi:hypothetical protein [Acidithiobacillus ferrivorans]|uniref:hypothetical protein n=1 Tax=Acidithiobacillus ferrivorans TaxID=160808 RepID=UPI0011D22916|nr:hypothetical protein [Acidithiobacillus ferrivorans]